MNETYTTFTDKMRKAFRAFGETCSRYLLGIGLTANAVTLIGCRSEEHTSELQSQY